MKVHSTLFSGHLLGCSSFCFGSAPNDYFAKNFGTTKKSQEINKALEEKYSSFSNNSLKAELKRLKREPERDVRKIKFVSGLLRSRLAKSDRKEFSAAAEPVDHDMTCKRNF